MPGKGNQAMYTAPTEVITTATPTFRHDLHRTMRLIRRHLAVVYLAAAGMLAYWLMQPGFPAPTLIAAWAIFQGVCVIWIQSAIWDERSSWAIRLQVTALGAVISGLALGNPSGNVALVSLLLFMVAVALLHMAHTLVRVLGRIQGQLKTVNAFSRVEAARQTLFFATFVAPVAMMAAPNGVGVAFTCVLCFVVNAVTLKRIRRRVLGALWRGEPVA